LSHLHYKQMRKDSLMPEGYALGVNMNFPFQATVQSLAASVPSKTRASGL